MDSFSFWMWGVINHVDAFVGSRIQTQMNRCRGNNSTRPPVAAHSPLLPASAWSLCATLSIILKPKWWPKAFEETCTSLAGSLHTCLPWQPQDCSPITSGLACRLRCQSLRMAPSLLPNIWMWFCCTACPSWWSHSTGLRRMFCASNAIWSAFRGPWYSETCRWCTDCCCWCCCSHRERFCSWYCFCFWIWIEWEWNGLDCIVFCFGIEWLRLELWAKWLDRVFFLFLFSPRSLFRFEITTRTCKLRLNNLDRIQWRNDWNGFGPSCSAWLVCFFSFHLIGSHPIQSILLFFHFLFAFVRVCFPVMSVCLQSYTAGSNCLSSLCYFPILLLCAWVFSFVQCRWRCSSGCCSWTRSPTPLPKNRASPPTKPLSFLQWTQAHWCSLLSRPIRSGHPPLVPFPAAAAAAVHCFPAPNVPMALRVSGSSSLLFVEL